MKNRNRILRQLTVLVVALVMCPLVFALEMPNRVGVDPSGLSGIHRVGMPYDIGPAVMLSGTAYYGYTESMGPVDGAHHRLGGIVGIGGRIWPFLGVALSFRGRYDIHPDDADGKDTGMVGDPRLLIRGGYPVSKDFHVGGEFGIVVPGINAPSLAWDAAVLDFKFLAALVPEGKRFALAAYGGFRLDNSANAGPDLERTRPGDRVALSVSDFHGVLLGLGASIQLAPFEILGEFSWDILLGDGVSSATESPIRLNLGARYYPIANLGIELLGEVVMSSRPGVGLDDPIVPIEPRVSVFLGLSYTFDFSKKDEAGEDSLEEDETEEDNGQFASVDGDVTDENEVPVEGAEVTLTAPGHSAETNTDENGHYRIESFPVGTAKIRIVREGFEDFEKDIAVTKDTPILLKNELSPVPEELPGSQLRGHIRAFDGRGVRAQITVAPLGEKLKSDEEGFFQIDLPPGRYKVKIKAKGYKKQSRKVFIEENGVSIINVDLRKAR